MELALEMTGISKSYGATSALSDISFVVPQGNTHAIIGENGAGKSTLIKILSGLVANDTGKMLLDGNSYLPKSLGDSRKSGVTTAFQDLSLSPNLSIAQNLLLPQLGSGLFVRHKDNETAASAVLSEHNLSHLDPRREVGSLALADKQKLEIVRAVTHRPKLLLLDEPSAALPDVDWLYKLLAENRSPQLTILYISHRLNEIRDLCQTATVLRNGKVIDTVSVADTDDSTIFGMMGGAVQGHSAKERSVRETGGLPAVSAHALHGNSVNNVSFSLHRGEILGVAALEGQGQAETFQMLAGVTRPDSGHVEVDGKRQAFAARLEL